MKTKTTISLIFTGLTLFIFAEDISAQFNFYDVTGQPVLSWGNSGSWDWGSVWHPKVIKDGDTLHMWYSGHDEGIWISNNIASIGYAWSLDGIDWNKHSSNPVLTADTLGWEGESISQCAVIHEADTFKMWYGADHWESPTSYVLSPSKKIGYALSLDGIDWTKHPDPVLEIGPESDWNDDFITPFTVIKEEGEYKMWYTAGRYGFPVGEDSFPQVGLATSSDGIEWTHYNDPETQDAPYAYSDPVLNVGSIGEWDSHRTAQPVVIKMDAVYLMFYNGLKAPINLDNLQEVGFATSTNGINWQKSENNPIISDDSSFVSWGREPYNGTLLFYEGKYHYWFACLLNPYNLAYPQIGYAISDPLGIGDYQRSLQFQSFYNWPNPFESSTTIEYKLTVPAIILITIYNHIGEKVEKFEKKQSQGTQQEVWNAEGLPAGIYFCVMKTKSQIQTLKMIKL